MNELDRVEIFFITVLVAIVISVCIVYIGSLVSSYNSSYNIEKKSEDTKKEIVVSDSLKVKYEIEYGSYYTGDHGNTPIIHKGEMTLNTSEYLLCDNGLPATDILMPASEIEVNLNGKKAKLHFPCYGGGSLLRTEGSKFHGIMETEVTKQENEALLVKSYPKEI